MDQGNIWTKARHGAITFCWIISGAVSLYVFQNAGRVEMKVDRLVSEQKAFVKEVREEQDFTRATESALNKNVANLAGQWTGSGQKEPSVLLIQFIEEARKEVRDEIKKRKGVKL